MQNTYTPLICNLAAMVVWIHASLNGLLASLTSEPESAIFLFYFILLI